MGSKQANVPTNQNPDETYTDLTPRFVYDSYSVLYMLSAKGREPFANHTPVVTRWYKLEGDANGTKVVIEQLFRMSIFMN